MDHVLEKNTNKELSEQEEVLLKENEIIDFDEHDKEIDEYKLVEKPTWDEEKNEFIYYYEKKVSNSENTNEKGNTVSSGNTVKTTQNQTIDNTTKDEKLPQTGNENFIIVLIAMFIGICGIISYVKYKRMI